jgi:hypothetical protein
MRKFTILMVLIAMTTYAMAQVQMGYAYESSKNQVTKSDIRTTKATPVWQVTFEEETPVWTLGSITGTKTWVVADTTPNYGYTNSNYMGGSVPVPPLWLYMGWKYVHDYSESGANFAYIDGISDLLGVGGNVGQVSDTYIRFDGIDLTGVMNPKLTFYQDYKALNQAFSYIDFSTDGGSNWTSVEVNEDVEGNAYGANFYELVASAYIADEANVSIRFRWQTTTNVIGGYGYGWQIDDITISDNPDYDMKFVHGRMNFFNYEDYTVSGQEDYYNYYTHYGNIPQIQYGSEYALSWFNVALESLGNITVTPEVTVQVFDPEMNEIFTNTVAGVSMATASKDTVDLIETDFALGADPMIGKYTVAYTISIPGQEDANPENNSDTTYFIVNDNHYFSRDIDKTSGSTGPCSWLDGGIDGEMFGTDFLFFFEDEITSMDVFIHANTTPETAIIGHIMQYESGTSTWVDISSSPLVTITEENLGHWMNVTFVDPVPIIYDEGYESKILMAAIEFYYGSEDNDIWIGYDPTVPVSSWATKWFLLSGSNAETWIAISNWSRGGICLHLNLNGYTITNSDMPIAERNISIYPNPTLGTLNIENVEGCNIQILNMMGQVVENIEKARMVNSVDMSRYANGTYFVKVINGKEVSTHKVNLMK